MTNHLRSFQLDGMPGITLQGVKGSAGQRGVHTYTNYYTDSSLFQYGRYDLWMTDEESSEPYNKNIYNCNVSDSPIPNDYLLYSQSGTIYLYKVDDYVNNSDVSTYDSSIISASYLNKIHTYYSTDVSTDLCLGKLLDTWKESENTISVVANTKMVSFKAWNGEYTQDSSSYYASITNNTVELVCFDVLSTTGNNLGKVKVTAEFHKDSTNYAEMGSTLINAWNGYTTIDPSYVYGYPENYEYTMNYDDENLGDFEIVIKDWTAATSQVFYTSPSYIKKETLQNYVISLYVYTSNNNIVTKTYIGEFNSSLI